MANKTKALARSAAPRASGASRLTRFKEQAAMKARGAAARAKATAIVKQGSIVSALSAGALGYAEQNGFSLPTVAGIDPALLYGAAMVFQPFVKGGLGQKIEQAGAGLLAVAAYKLGSGQSVVGWDDVQGEGDGGW